MPNSYPHFKLYEVTAGGLLKSYFYSKHYSTLDEMFAEFDDHIKHNKGLFKLSKYANRTENLNTQYCIQEFTAPYTAEIIKLFKFKDLIPVDVNQPAIKLKKIGTYKDGGSESYRSIDGPLEFYWRSFAKGKKYADDYGKLFKGDINDDNPILALGKFELSDGEIIVQ